MQNKISKHHHFIPVFLIKKFAGIDNKMWVYDKKSKRFNKNKQSPKAIFYEMNRNLSEFEGKKVDYIEKIYGDLDDLIAKTLDDVISKDAINGYELQILIYFVSLMKWRVPKVDTLTEELLPNLNLSDLGAAIRPKDPSVAADPKILEKFDNLEIMQQVKRLLLPIQIALNEDHFSDLYKDSYIITHFDTPGLLGDCITIEKDNKNPQIMHDFVFPLSNTKTLICKKDAKKQNPHPIFPEWKDLAIFHLSEKKVACQDRSYLEKIIKTYETLEQQGKINRLVHYIFDLIP